MAEELKVGQGIPFDPIEPDTTPPHLDPEFRSETTKDSKKDAGADLNKRGKGAGTRIAVILLVILTVFSLSAAGALYMIKEDEVNNRLKLEADLEEAVLSKLEVEEKLQDIIYEKRQLEADLNTSKDNYKFLMSQYHEELAENEKIREKFQGKVKLIASLQSKLKKEERDSSTLGVKLARVTSEYEDVKRQLSQIRMAKEALENRILQLSRKNKANTVELEKIVVSGTPAAPSKPAIASTAASGMPYIPLGPPARLEGQVLVVNKEFAFVVINIGEKDGIKDAEVLDVFRGQQKLGKVQVERIYDTMSSAVILPGATVGDIKEGDIVKLL